MEIIWNLLSGVGIEVTMKTHLQPAPDDLLKIIRGQCKSNCDSKRCTCQKKIELSVPLVVASSREIAVTMHKRWILAFMMTKNVV